MHDVTPANNPGATRTQNHCHNFCAKKKSATPSQTLPRHDHAGQPVEQYNVAILEMSGDVRDADNSWQAIPAPGSAARRIAGLREAQRSDGQAQAAYRRRTASAIPIDGRLPPALWTLSFTAKAQRAQRKDPKKLSVFHTFAVNDQGCAAIFLFMGNHHR